MALLVIPCFRYLAFLPLYAVNYSIGISGF